jgi:hypothetical protein
MGFLGKLNREEIAANREIVFDGDASKRDRLTAAVDTGMGSGASPGATAFRAARHIPGGKFVAISVGKAYGGPAGGAGVQAGMAVDGHVEDRAKEMRAERAERPTPVLSDIDTPSAEGPSADTQIDSYDRSR